MEIKNIYLEEKENNPLSPDEIRPYLYDAIRYRQWAEVCKLVERTGDSAKETSFWEKEFLNAPINSLKKMLALNIDFLRGAKNRSYFDKLKEYLGEEKWKKIESELDNEDVPVTYDEPFFENGKNVFDIFWNGDQPVMDVKYIEKQTLPALQVMKNGASMVIDEVGTGKTVAAIYTMQQIIQEWINDGKQHPLGILVVCPYNKRKDWEADILRQLGRKSRVVDQGKGPKIWLSAPKKEAPNIYISGNNKSQLKEDLFCFYKDPRWDLIVIDECDRCFDYDYRYPKAKRVLFLTATPIVVSGEKTRGFSAYVGKMRAITGCWRFSEWAISPIKDGTRKIATEDDIFTCNFKEDIFPSIKIHRDIRFLECERDPRRQEWFWDLRNKENFFSAIFSDQDDQRLADTVFDRFGGEKIKIEKNHKMEQLLDLLQGRAKDCEDCGTDSVLIFCETIKTVESIYQRLRSGDFYRNLPTKSKESKALIGKLYGKHAEVEGMPEVNNDTIIDVMTANIRHGSRSILVATGKSCGTGLNFGEFDAVIHYELPFTSNELEQRFGRIERADDLIRAEQTAASGERLPICNKMIFLLNKRRAVNVESEEMVFEDDLEANRMLYYSIDKIYTTVECMPIRNTVLYAPALIERVKEMESDAWNKAQETLNNSDDYFGDYANYLYLNRRVKKAIDNIEESLSAEEKNKIKSMNDAEKIKCILNNVRENDVIKENKETLKEYQDYMVNYENARTCEAWIEGIIRSYLKLENMMTYWNVIVKDPWADTEISGKVGNVFEIVPESADEQGDIEDNEDENETSDENSAEKMDGRTRKWSDALDTAVKAIREKYVCMEPDKSKIIACLNNMCSAILNALEQVRADSNYSGVFYRYNGEIKRVEWEEGKKCE